MNYSTYFENKIAEQLFKDYNVFVLSEKNLILQNFSTPSIKAVDKLIDKLDPYNVLYEGNTITLEVFHG